MSAVLARAREAAAALAAARAPGVLDAVTGLARVKVASALVAMVAQYRDSTSLSALERLRLVGQINAMVTELGGAVQAEPSESAEVKALRAIARGLHDAESLAELYGRMQEAINALSEAGQLDGLSETVAHEAITHWAELESTHAAA